MTVAVQDAGRRAFYDRMAEKHLTPLWTIMSDAVPHEPRARFEPAYWDYSNDIRPALMEAADIISAEEAQRRVLILNNPSLPRGATHTLFCALQLIKAARSHRRTGTHNRHCVSLSRGRGPIPRSTAKKRI